VHDTSTRTADRLSLALRQGTRDEHAAAEATSFVGDLMAGQLDVAAYADRAVQQHAIYAALESAGDDVARHDRDGRSVVLDQLERLPSIEADLHHLLGPQWRTRSTVLAATHEYTARLRQTGARLTLWVAHAYTRYLGDLSGGQIIHRALQRHYGLADEGLSFYRFTAARSPKPLRDLYRERLDALPFTADQQAEVVAEAQVAFAHNRAVLAALGTRHRSRPAHR
jgi:heme oxygenase (biliverdin-producing, ferredoxin)